ncbi:MAG: O-antigen ligase family protein [Patescibacteria group bacterium]
MTFAKQFLGRPFWWALGGFVMLDVASFLALHTTAELVLLILLTIALIVVAVRCPQWLFPLAIAEIIATSNGHSFNVELAGASIGPRIILFALLMIVTVIAIARHGIKPVPRPYRLICALVTAVVFLAVLQGLILGSTMTNLYLDANGYLAIGYVLAAWYWVRDGRDRHRLLQLTAAATVWIAAKTLLFLFAFGHLHPKTLPILYTWIRDTRLGEITFMQATIWRVFLQSQWFLVPAALVSTSYMLLAERHRETGVRVVLLITAAALIASFSRTFWLATLIAALGLIVIALWQRVWKSIGRTATDGAVVTIGSIALLWVIVAVPIYQGASSSIFQSLLRGRATQTSDAALDSRRQLLPPLMEAIRRAPISGHGLGKTVAYTTEDPRYQDEHGTDQVTTYAFEWGWLDYLVKFGIAGTLLFGICWLLIARDIVLAFRHDPARRWLYAGLGMSLIALLIAHTFSPYLNHPIGWGTIAIIVALLPRSTAQQEGVTTQRSVDVPSMPTSSPLVTGRVK